MAVIGINYSGSTYYYDNNGESVEIDPSDPRYLKYESVYIYYQGGEKVFDSGNFIKDWYAAKFFFATQLMDKELLSGSSTCDHFHFDGANFDSAYLHMVNGEAVLKYLDKSDENWFLNQRDIYENGWKFFVEKGTTPTWSELKEYCKS